MILGIGTDVTSIDRIRNSRVELDKLANKILTEYELSEYQKHVDKNPERFLAKRWAAKEAISKAWGTGISGDTRFKSIEIRHDTQGRPTVCFWDKLKSNAEVLGVKCHLSLSDEGDTVIAYSILEYHV
jgi:holo-[acyl-carrier protein] synthase